MERKIALRVDDKDNVATVFANEVRDGDTQDVTVTGDVPYGHKIAAQAIEKGEKIVKYGEVIGVATTDIRRGEYVHVHNLDALRGRGDL